MERQLKQRVVGAALLVAFGVIFIPIFLDNDAITTAVPPAVEIPPPPEGAASSVLPLDEPTIESLTAGIETPPTTADDTAAATPSEMAADLPAESTAPADAANGQEASPTSTPVQAAATGPDNGPEIGNDTEHAETRTPIRPEVRTPIKSSADAGSASVSAATSGWAIQLGSFSSEDNARRLLDKLRTAGYTAYLERHREGASTVFKVRVGPERQRADAVQLRDRLEREFASKGILRPYR